MPYKSYNLQQIISMGRTKRTQMTPSNPRTQGGPPSTSIREYLQTPAILAASLKATNMALASPGSTASEAESMSAHEILPPPTPDWYALFASLSKKEDFQQLVDEVMGTLHSEISSIRTSLTSLKTCVSALEERGPQANGPDPATIRHQAAQITDMRMHIEDLDNRSRRNNIRVQGLKETWKISRACAPKDRKALYTPSTSGVSAIGPPRQLQKPSGRITQHYISYHLAEDGQMEKPRPYRKDAWNT
ncbi:Hypothetical predicted protein [Pelobates cultripes]|uniref:Uncharacterized protein n=1 Tax=Pelobates cultripes TaxID=61616 RepID=A0AAD1RFZ4_PELCU|nr:Hypothetical predicted protein [Pelobates cultripes]